MSKLLSKEFYGNHYYLNIDSEIGSVSRLAANPWQYHQPSSSSKSTSSCSATCQTASAQPSTSMYHLSKPRQHEKIQGSSSILVVKKGSSDISSDAAVVQCI